MEWIFKKMGPAAAVSLVAFTGVLNAADDAQVRNLENRVSALEQQKKTGGGGMINPPARPVVTDGADIFIYGEFLWLKPYQDDMVYAMDLHNVTPTAFNSNIDASTKDWKGKFGPGFRLGIGYNTQHDGWDLDLKWMRFHSRHSGDDDDDNDCCEQVPGVFQPEFFPKDFRASTDVPQYVADVSPRKWKLRVNEVTLDLGREFFVSKWMTLRPYVGVKYAQINQSARVDYLGGTFIPSLAANFAGATTDRVRNKNNFWGVGIDGGLNTIWGLGYGVSIYGRADLALVWGKFKVSQTHKLLNATSSQIRSHMKEKFKNVRPISELALGLRYDTTFSDNAWGFGIWAGWEHHYYWSQNKMIKFVGRDYNVLDEWDGDLSLIGLDVGVSFDF